MELVSRWAVLCRRENRLDGIHEHLRFKDCLPMLFVTRKEARDYIKAEFGYLTSRPDLRTEPFGWKMPIPVRVTVTLAVRDPEATGID